MSTILRCSATEANGTLKHIPTWEELKVTGVNIEMTSDSRPLRLPFL